MRALLLTLPLFLSLAACGEDPKDDTQQPEETSIPEDTGPDGPSFAGDVQPLLTDKCERCHGGMDTYGGLDVTSYDALMASGAVVAGDSGASQLVNIGSHHGSGWFAPEEVDTISGWIDAGALND